MSMDLILAYALSLRESNIYAEVLLSSRLVSYESRKFSICSNMRDHIGKNNRSRGKQEGGQGTMNINCARNKTARRASLAKCSQISPANLISNSQGFNILQC